MRTRLGSPVRANFEITDACPLACQHCYTYWGYSSTGRRNSKDRSGRTLADLEAVLRVIVDSGIQVITFTGGEPLARKDLLYPLVRQAKHAGLRVLVNTSGTMLTSRDADELAELQVDGLLVSLMSSQEDVNNRLAHANSYSRTVRAIRFLTARNLPVTINMVCSKMNYQTVRDTAQLAVDLGAMMFSATPLLPTPGNTMANQLHLDADELRSVMFDLAWAKDNLPIRVTTLDPVAHCQFDAEERAELGGLLGERYCCAGISDCAVSADGDLRACIMTDQVGGNLLVDGWERSWDAVASWRSPEILPTECLECELVDQCGGGCRVAAQATTGRLNGRDPYMTTPIRLTGGNASTRTFGEAERHTPSPDDRFDFNPEMITRPEPFGGSLFLRGKATFLRQSPFDMVSDQITRGTFSARDWSLKYEAPISSVLSFVAVLADDDFLQPARGGE